MIDRFCPTLGQGVLWREVRSTAAAFGVLALVGFFGAMLLPDIAAQVLARFTAQLGELGLADGAARREVAAALFFNNASAAALSMLYGLVPFLPLSALALGTNAMLLGVLAALYRQAGLGLGLYLLGVLPHGIFELPALILSCAMGLLLCRTGTERLRRREDAAPFLPRVMDCLRAFALLAVPLLIAAALVEAYVTPALLARAM